MLLCWSVTGRMPFVQFDSDGDTSTVVSAACASGVLCYTAWLYRYGR